MGGVPVRRVEDILARNELEGHVLPDFSQKASTDDKGKSVCDHASFRVSDVADFSKDNRGDSCVIFEGVDRTEGKSVNVLARTIKAGEVSENAPVVADIEHGYGVPAMQAGVRTVACVEIEIVVSGADGAPFLSLRGAVLNHR